jgi:hypothetical protein
VRRWCDFRRCAAESARRSCCDRLIEATGIGLLYDDLADPLHDAAELRRARDAVAAHRRSFTFDAHADGLIALFRGVRAGERPVLRWPL